MTHETKAGLVVSCSFLCLVGVVVYSKLHAPKPHLADEYAEGSVEAPPAPTPLEEEKPAPFLDADSTSQPVGRAAVRADEKGSDLPMSSVDGYNIPAPSPSADATTRSTTTNDFPGASTTKTDSVSRDKQDSPAPVYAIPEPVDDDKKTPSRPTSANCTASENKDAKNAATLEPIQQFTEAKDSQESKDTSPASLTMPSESSAKDGSKNSVGVRNAQARIEDATLQKDTSKTELGSISSQNGSANPKTSNEQEPPPIPAGVSDPFRNLRNLPETPEQPANGSAKAEQSSRETPRKAISPAGTSPTNSGTKTSGITAITAAPSQGGTSSLTGTAPTKTTPTLTDPSLSSPAQGPNNGYSKNQLATSSGSGRSLTPGVMPSPRSLMTSPTGDTAPEPNVRLGPPAPSLPSSTAPIPASDSSPSSPAAKSPDANPASALPPANQLAQGPAPNPSMPPSSDPRSPGLASGPGAGRVSAPPVAQVDSYDEETYLCKQGDTFAAISTKFYLTEKYAQALLLFNRNHPRATAGVRQDPPALAAGQPVYVPPLRVLEKRYGTAIPDRSSELPGSLAPSDGNAPATKTLAPDASSGSQPAHQNYTIPESQSPAPSPPSDRTSVEGGGQKPTPDSRTPILPAAPEATTVPSKTSPARNADRTYVVPKGGETFWEISRRTLGNPNRWSEISRLNPQVDPKYPVSADTKLRMPPDARLDPPTSAPAEKGS